MTARAWARLSALGRVGGARCAGRWSRGSVARSARCRGAQCSNDRPGPPDWPGSVGGAGRGRRAGAGVGKFPGRAGGRRVFRRDVPFLCPRHSAVAAFPCRGGRCVAAGRQGRGARLRAVVARCGQSGPRPAHSGGWPATGRDGERRDGQGLPGGGLCAQDHQPCVVGAQRVLPARRRRRSRPVAEPGSAETMRDPVPGSVHGPGGYRRPGLSATGTGRSTPRAVGTVAAASVRRSAERSGPCPGRGGVEFGCAGERVVVDGPQRDRRRSGCGVGGSEGSAWSGVDTVGAGGVGVDWPLPRGATTGVTRRPGVDDDPGGRLIR